MSRHHENEIVTTNIRDKREHALFILFTQISPLRTKHKAPLEAIRGHGLFSTR